jgi:hypothetical protein
VDALARRGVPVAARPRHAPDVAFDRYDAAVERNSAPFPVQHLSAEPRHGGATREEAPDGRRRSPRDRRARARDLGLAEWAVSLWLRKHAAPVLRAVEIAPAPPPAAAVTAPVPITPQGVRIEGAPVEALAMLLRALQ